VMGNGRLCERVRGLRCRWCIGSVSVKVRWNQGVLVRRPFPGCVRMTGYLRSRKVPIDDVKVCVWREEKREGPLFYGAPEK